MKALLSVEVGGPETLVIEDLPSPEATPGSVVVQVKACGVNYPDVIIIEDKYQFKPPRPFSPGGEISGVVKAVGEGVTTLKVGDRVLGNTGSGGMREELSSKPRARGCRCPSDVRRGGGLPDDLWHLLLRAEGSRPSRARRDPAGAGRGRGRRPVGGGAGQGDGRAGDRGGLVAGEGRPGHRPWRGERRGLSARPVRPRRPEGAGGPVQEGLRPGRRQCDLRRRRRRLCGGVAALDRLGGTVPGHRLSRRAFRPCR